MLRRIPRLLRRAVVVAVLVAVSASVYQSWSAGSPGSAGWVQTEFGPLGPADRDLLVKVRLAGLWEGPTGQQAESQASSAEVREVGGKLAVEHAQLDEEVRRVAGQLGVLLPSGPTAQQNAWMDEISSATGSDYDRVFVQRVREAHGQVLPVIAGVRAGTRNDLIRQFAGTADEFVSRHHEYLEGTGLVDYSALPHHGPGLFGGGTEMRDLIVPFLVFAAALLAAVALFWGLHNRPTPVRKERITMPPEQAVRIPQVSAVPAIPAPRRPTIEDTGPVPLISDVDTEYDGRYRAAATVDDSGSHRAVSTSGSHRMPRSRARHSLRR
jgi:predicted outer membrane protein